jgi:hypothetical protein
MKKLLIGLLALGSISAFSSDGTFAVSESKVFKSYRSDNVWIGKTELNSLKDQARTKARGECEENKIEEGKCVHISTDVSKITHTYEGFNTFPKINVTVDSVFKVIK